MGWFGRSSDQVAYEPTRNGMQIMRHKDGRPVMRSELTKGQRQSTGQSTKGTSRAGRKGAVEFGREPKGKRKEFGR